MDSENHEYSLQNQKSKAAANDQPQSNTSRQS